MNPGERPAAEDPPAKPQRLASLDAFRGATIAGMILVNNPGSWDHIYPPLRHSDWHGCTPTDLVFPFFLFIMGTAMAFSLRRYLESDHPRRGLWVRTARRVIVLLALGLLLNASGAIMSGIASLWNGPPTLDLGDVRIPGVLQRIALVYLLAVPAVVLLRIRWQIALAATILIGYTLLLRFVPVPGNGTPSISPDANWCRWLDLQILPAHRLWSGSPTDPEGLLATLPALVTTLAGYWTGLAIRSRPIGAAACRRLVLIGVATSTAGLLAALAVPLNKPLWTPSYVVFTAGLAVIILAAMLFVIDARHTRRPFEPLIDFGVNAIFVFVASGVVGRLLIMLPSPTADTALKTWLYEQIAATGIGSRNASLAFAIATVLAWWGVLALMRRMNITIRV